MAYRTITREYHPDRHHDDLEAERKMKDINEAYETLSDPDKRARYDASLPPELDSMRDELGSVREMLQDLLVRQSPIAS